jgi:hypothetical protein
MAGCRLAANNTSITTTTDPPPNDVSPLLATYTWHRFGGLFLAYTWHIHINYSYSHLAFFGTLFLFFFSTLSLFLDKNARCRIIWGNLASKNAS